MERKLKNAISRRPKDKVGIDEIVREVASRTGFTQKDVKEVYQTLMKVWKERMLSRTQSIIVPALGTLMPWLRPSRRGVALHGNLKEHEIVKIPATWTIRFIPAQAVKAQFKAKVVTEEQENNLYKD